MERAEAGKGTIPRERKRPFPHPLPSHSAASGRREANTEFRCSVDVEFAAIFAATRDECHGVGRQPQLVRPLPVAIKLRMTPSRSIFGMWSDGMVNNMTASSSGERNFYLRPAIVLARHRQISSIVELSLANHTAVCRVTRSVKQYSNDASGMSTAILGHSLAPTRVSSARSVGSTRRANCSRSTVHSRPSATSAASTISLRFDTTIPDPLHGPHALPGCRRGA